MSDGRPDGPIPGASQRTNNIMRHWEAEHARLNSWFIERRIQPDANLFLNDLLHYVTAHFDNTAGHNCLIWVSKYSDIDSEYIPSLRKHSEEYFKVAEAYAKHRLEGTDLEAFLLAVRTRLDSRIHHWKAQALRYLESAEATVLAEQVPGTPLEVDREQDGGPNADARPRVNEGDRRAVVDAYIEEVFKRTGKRITRTHIWKSARYKSRTEFERWERNDPKNPNKTAHERFTHILTEKPHLK